MRAHFSGLRMFRMTGKRIRNQATRRYPKFPILM